MNIEKINKNIPNGWSLTDNLVMEKTVRLNKEMKTYLGCRFMYSSGKKEAKIVLRITYYRITSNKQIVKGSIKDYTTKCKKPLFFKKRGIIKILIATCELLTDDRIKELYKSIKAKR